MGDHPVHHPRPLGALPVRNPKVAARVIQGEAMVLSPHDAIMHAFSPVATRVWELLPTHRTMEALVEAITSEYDVDAETARQDIEELIDQMLEKRIVQWES